MLTPSRIILLPMAAAAVCQPVQATTYLSLEQAQQVLFADQMLTPVPLLLSAEQILSIERESGTHYYPGQCAPGAPTVACYWSMRSSASMI